MKIIYFIVGLLIIILIIIYYNNRINKIKKELSELKFEYKSMHVKHGKAWEDFVPFMPEFEKIANKDNFTFIGMPVDGIAFDDDAIKFFEIKTGKGQLNPKQKKVKELVQNKKVEWHELRF